VPEQLALDELAADRSAVDRDERPAGPRARLVDGLRDELLAGPALAPDEHRQVRLRHLLDLLEDAAHRSARADHRAQAVVAPDSLEQQPVLVLEAPSLEGARHDEADLVVVEGLRHVVLGAGLHRLDRDLLGPVCRDHHHGSLGARGLDRPQDVHAGGRAAEGEVGDHEVEGAFAEPGDGLGSVARVLHLVTEPSQQARQSEPDGSLVLDHQHARGHRVSARLGSTRVSSVPLPSWDVASSMPPCASTSFLDSASPRPVPALLDV
jgi:hypothetical protein